MASFEVSTKTPAAPWPMALRRALVAANWTVSASLHQTRIYSEVVAEQPKPVAYFLVDAMRFEMGVELAERLPKSAEVSVRPAIVRAAQHHADWHGRAAAGGIF